MWQPALNSQFLFSIQYDSLNLNFYSHIVRLQTMQKQPATGCLKETLSACRQFSTYHKAVEFCKEAKTSATGDIKQLSERMVASEKVIRETSDKSAKFTPAAIFHKADTDERLFMNAVEETDKMFSLLDNAMKRNEAEQVKVEAAKATLLGLEAELNF